VRSVLLRRAAKERTGSEKVSDGSAGKLALIIVHEEEVVDGSHNHNAKSSNAEEDGKGHAGTNLSWLHWRRCGGCRGCGCGNGTRRRSGRFRIWWHRRHHGRERGGAVVPHASLRSLLDRVGASEGPIRNRALRKIVDLAISNDAGLPRFGTSWIKFCRSGCEVL